MSFHYFVNPYSTQQPSIASMPATPTASHHRRRGPRISVSNNQKHMRPQRPSARDLTTDITSISLYRHHFEQWISFDLEDDMEFCPTLVTDNDFVSSTSGSERSSQAGDSPHTSPLQHPQTMLPALTGRPSSSVSPTCSISLPSAASHQLSMVPLFEPAASRSGKAIPIINPATGLSSPSSSPSHMMRAVHRRW